MNALEKLLNEQKPHDAYTEVQALLASFSEIILDKPEQLTLSLACILANGHLLLQDLPGMGKTTLAECLARSLGLQFNRVQFTSDLMPSDMLGTSIFNRETHQFDYHKGAVFCQLLLADEINRASPKTQSALLEAMEERQVTQEGVTRKLPEPFFVIATQNPAHQSGTYPLPESQLDRFLMCLSLGYPSVNAERELLRGVDRRVLLAQLTAKIDTPTLLSWQARVTTVTISETVLDYVQRLVAKTREIPNVIGLSTRGALALLHAGKAFAWINGRTYLMPEDIQAVFVAVASHRMGLLQSSKQNTAGQIDPLGVMSGLMREVPVIVARG